jgi:hypothetical protein
MAKPFVGTWKTQWISYDNEVEGVCTLTVTESFRTDPSGQVLDGMWDAPNAQPGTLHGTLSESGESWKWEGEWWVSPTERGGFEFTLDTDSDGRFTGWYSALNRPDPPHKDWNGTLMRRHQDAG